LLRLRCLIHGFIIHPPPPSPCVLSYRFVLVPFPVPGSTTSTGIELSLLIGFRNCFCKDSPYYGASYRRFQEFFFPFFLHFFLGRVLSETCSRSPSSPPHLSLITCPFFWKFASLPLKLCLFFARAAFAPCPFFLLL